MWTDDELLGSSGGKIRTKGHQYWYMEHPEWLISTWAAGRVQVTEYCKMQYRITVFFKLLIRTNGLVVQVSRCELGDLGLIPDECLIALPRLRHFAWH